MKPVSPRPVAGGLLALALCLCLTGLSGCINTRPRPMSVACNGLTQGQFVRRCTALLIENNYQIVEADSTSTPAQVQATRRQRQLNIGENMQYNGPYLFAATYTKGGSIAVTVATTMRRGSDSNTKPLILQTHNESSGTSPADKQAFEPILRGLRQACGQP